MLALFRMPETATTCDLHLLDDFITTVQASPLPLTTKEDAVKVLQCLRWVKANLDNIQTFIDNKTDYLPDLPAVDQKNGVIRDHFGSSLHFNAYASGTTAMRDLATLVQAVESGFDHLRTWGPLALWSAIAQFNDDKDRGCLEARVAPFTECLGALESTHGLCQLEDVLQVCQLLYFLSIDDDTYNFLMADEFFSPHYGQTVLYQGVPVELTEALLFDAMVDIFPYTTPPAAALAEAREQKQTEPQQWQAHILQELTRKATVVQGQRGMIQYQFNEEEEAKQYLTWLKQQSTLQSHHIDKCHIKPENGQFVVQLLPIQLGVLTGSDSPMSSTVAPPPSTVSLVMSSPSVVTPSSVSPPSAIDEMEPDALCASTQDYTTLLYWAAEDQDSADFQALINKASKDTINQALVMAHTNDLTILHWTAYRHDSTAFQALMNKASEDAINQALVMVDINGITPLLFAAEFQDSTTFQALVNKVSEDAINKALAMEDTIGITPLHCAAEKQNSAAFQALVNKASKETINQVLMILDETGQTPLHLATYKQDSVAFQTLIKKTSKGTINKALVMVDTNGNTPLLLAADKQDSAAFQALLNKASEDAINQALLMVEKSGNTPLHCAAAKQDSTAFQALLNKASKGAINKALVMANEYGLTPLFLAADNQDSTAFQALVNKASKDVINKALVMAHTNGQTPLLLGTYKQDSTAFQALLNKASKGAISEALVMVDKNDQTPLLLAAKYQDSTAFQALVNKASEDAINEALVVVDKNGETPFHWAIKNQNHEVFDVLLDKASSSTLHQILSGVDEQMLFSAYALDDLRLWTSVLLKIEGSTEHLPPPNTPGSIDACIQLLLRSLSASKDPKTIRLGRHLALCLLTLQTKDTFTVTLGDGSSIPINSPELVTSMEIHGLRDWDDYHRLKTIAATRPEATALHACLGLMEECQSLRPSPSPDEHRIHQTLNEGLLLVKTFTGWQPKAWPDFLNQLNTPTERAVLRQPLGTAHTPFKFTHVTADVAPYEGKKYRPKASHRTHAKKQSATLISPKKNTPLFQSQHEDLPLVGIACCADPHLDDRHYDPAKAKLRALLEYDTGTYDRPWRGNETEVRAYAAKTKNYTTLEAFKTAVAKNTKKTNEVLMQPSRSSLLGIVLGEETPSAIKLAYQYQRDVYKTLGLILPIMYYNAKTHTLILNWEKKHIWDNPTHTKTLFCSSLIYQNYIKAIERLGAYYGAPKPFDSSEPKISIFSFFSMTPPHTAIISDLVKQHTTLLKDNPMERTLPALLTELETRLRDHGETIDPRGPLSDCLRDIQASLPTPIINIARLNASMVDRPAAGGAGIEPPHAE